jgi:hypothetical protein
MAVSPLFSEIMCYPAVIVEQCCWSWRDLLFDPIACVGCHSENDLQIGVISTKVTWRIGEDSVCLTASHSFYTGKGTPRQSVINV